MKPGTTNRPEASRVSAALVRPETGDDAVDDGDVALEPLAREDREDPAAANDEIGALVSARDGDPSFETRHRGDDNVSSGNEPTSTFSCAAVTDIPTALSSGSLSAAGWCGRWCAGTP